VAVNQFQERIAVRVDADGAEMFQPHVLLPAVDRLAELAGDGLALELGIGTGRVALPLRERGVDVHGVDLSPAMIRQLRAKPGGDAVPVSIGDIAGTTVPGTFSLVYAVWNTFMNLTTQDEQVRCFRTAAAHLRPGGHVLLEVMVPALQGLPPGETVRPFTVSATRLGFDEYDVVGQGLTSHHYWVEGDRLEVWSCPFRYVWPAELDLMARLAGLTLTARWGGWKGEPFTRDSSTHVSVWSKDAAAR
jgi:SAM-dependent methyltransferase